MDAASELQQITVFVRQQGGVRPGRLRKVTYYLVMCPKCQEERRVTKRNCKALKTGYCRKCWQEERPKRKPNLCVDCEARIQPRSKRCQPCWAKALARRNHSDAAVLAMNRARSRKGGRVKTSKGEERMAELLTLCEISFERHSAILSYNPDFYLPEYNLVLEVFGRHWHQDQDREEKRRKKIEAEGYLFLAVWGDEPHLWWKVLASTLGWQALAPGLSAKCGTVACQSLILSSRKAS